MVAAAGPGPDISLWSVTLRLSLTPLKQVGCWSLRTAVVMVCGLYDVLFFSSSFIGVIAITKALFR